MPANPNPKSPGKIFEMFRAEGYPAKDPDGYRMVRHEAWVTPKEYKAMIDDGFREIPEGGELTMLLLIVRRAPPEMLG